MMTKNKRGDTPTTLTWIPALIAIFIIMFVFTLASLFLSGTKGDSVISVEEMVGGDLASAEILVYMMNDDFEIKEERNKLKEFLKEWSEIDDVGERIDLEKEIKEYVLEKFEGGENYYFSVEHDSNNLYSGSNLNIERSARGSFSDVERPNFFFISSSYLDASLFSRSSAIIYFPEERILVKLYFGGFQNEK
jgi:hypothetical protein